MVELKCLGEEEMVADEEGEVVWVDVGGDEILG